MKTSRYLQLTKSHNSSGMVSLVITMIVMVIITITVLGFSQVARRNQRQTLDKQLSSQAYYAAESGVNSAFSIIKTKYLANNILPPDQSSCRNDPSGNYDLFKNNANKIDSATNTEYTCVLIDAAPSSVSYPLRTDQGSRVFPIQTNGTPIDTISISWEPDENYSDPTVYPVSACKDDSKSQPSVKADPPLPVWDCKFGMIRIDLVPMTSLSRADMLADTFTGFLSPDTAGVASVPFATGEGINSTGVLSGGNFCGNNPTAPACTFCSDNPSDPGCIQCDLSSGGRRPASCTAFCLLHPLDVKACLLAIPPSRGGGTNQGVRPAAVCDDKTCKLDITGLTGTGYHARVSTIYRNTTLTVSASSAGVPQDLVGVQAVIDATGRAQDVLKRIQARIPLVNTTDRLHNDYALESTNGICKTFFAFPGYNYVGHPADWNWCD